MNKWDYIRSSLLYKLIIPDYSDEVKAEIRKILEHMETFDRLEREGKQPEDSF